MQNLICCKPASPGAEAKAGEGQLEAQVPTPADYHYDLSQNGTLEMGVVTPLNFMKVLHHLDTGLEMKIVRLTHAHETTQDFGTVSLTFLRAADAKRVFDPLHDSQRVPELQGSNFRYRRLLTTRFIPHQVHDEGLYSLMVYADSTAYYRGIAEGTFNAAPHSQYYYTDVGDRPVVSTDGYDNPPDYDADPEADSRRTLTLFKEVAVELDTHAITAGNPIFITGMAAFGQGRAPW